MRRTIWTSSPSGRFRRDVVLDLTSYNVRLHGTVVAGLKKQSASKFPASLEKLASCAMVCRSVGSPGRIALFFFQKLAPAAVLLGLGRIRIFFTFQPETVPIHHAAL